MTTWIVTLKVTRKNKQYLKGTFIRGSLDILINNNYSHSFCQFRRNSYYYLTLQVGKLIYPSSKTEFLLNLKALDFEPPHEVVYAAAHYAVYLLHLKNGWLIYKILKIYSLIYITHYLPWVSVLSISINKDWKANKLLT